MPPRDLIYLDHNATTPVDPRVLAAMLPYFTESFANAASAHAPGHAAAAAVERARRQVAALIHADPREIVFTSGATEANNLAIKGAAGMYRDKGRHIVTAMHEHSAVIDPCKRLQEDGCDVTWLRPNAGGVIDPQQVADAVRQDTVLVSIMAANNETGTLNDIAAIGAVCKQRRVLFHTDATQRVGKLPVDVQAAGVDLLSASAHKFYGPKGAGFLYVRRKGPRARLVPLFDGGGHERAMRSGTLNVPGIVGLGEAADVGAQTMAQDAARLGALRDRLEGDLARRLGDVVMHGDRTHRMPHVTNMSFIGVDSQDLLATLIDTVAVSAGSACSSASLAPSYVLRAMAVDDDVARAAVRFSLGRGNTQEQIDLAVQCIVESVQRLRAHPPDRSDTCDPHRDRRVREAALRVRET